MLLLLGLFEREGGFAQICHWHLSLASQTDPLWIELLLSVAPVHASPHEGRVRIGGILPGHQLHEAAALLPVGRQGAAVGRKVVGGEGV